MSAILSTCKNTQICLLLQSGGGNSRLISQHFCPMQNIIGYKAPNLRNHTKLVHKTVLAGKTNLPVSCLHSSHSATPLTSAAAHPGVIWQQPKLVSLTGMQLGIFRPEDVTINKRVSKLPPRQYLR